MHRPHPLRLRQRGISLISLMVGLAISMIVILATLMLFQRTMRATTEARRDAQADAQRSSAFLSAGIAVQEAGYWIENAQLGNHLIVLANANLNNSTLSGNSVGLGNSGNAVVWTENSTGIERCSALLAPNGEGEGGLLKLGPVPCSDATSFADLTWDAKSLAIFPSAVISIMAQAADCSPFGVFNETSANKIRLTFSASNSNGVVLNSSSCLLNISAS